MDFVIRMMMRSLYKKKKRKRTSTTTVQFEEIGDRGREMSLGDWICSLVVR